jgi:hypothetical protein
MEAPGPALETPSWSEETHGARPRGVSLCNMIVGVLLNRQRLNGGRNARGRKEAVRPIEPIGEGTQLFPPGRPPASSAC